MTERLNWTDLIRPEIYLYIRKKDEDILVNSTTGWTWVWVSSRRPGVLQSMGFQRVRHDWVTELIDWLKITADGDWSHEIRRCLLLRRKPIANLVKMKVKFTQLCQTLCDPMNYTVHGILQAGILEWVVVPVSRGSFQRRDQTQVPHIAGRCLTSWAARKAPSCASSG